MTTTRLPWFIDRSLHARPRIPRNKNPGNNIRKIYSSNYRNATRWINTLCFLMYSLSLLISSRSAQPTCTNTHTYLAPCWKFDGKINRARFARFSRSDLAKVSTAKDYSPAGKSRDGNIDKGRVTHATLPTSPLSCLTLWKLHVQRLIQLQHPPSLRLRHPSPSTFFFHVSPSLPLSLLRPLTTHRATTPTSPLARHGVV